MRAEGAAASEKTDTKQTLLRLPHTVSKKNELTNKTINRKL
jgi:hypothetical protein